MSATGPAQRVLVGDWVVDMAAHRLERQEAVVILEPRQMAVLAALCQKPGEVLSADELLETCWPGESTGDNPVHKAIAALRRAFEDSATTPRYIATIRKQGYRLIAAVRVLSSEGPRSRQGGWRGQSPFRGLEPFGPLHAGVFFGRDAAVAELHARLDAQWQRGQPLVLLLGPSGSGKTSLVHAGLLPAVRSAASPSSARSLLQVSTAATADLGAPGDWGHWSALAGALLDWEFGAAPALCGYSIETLAKALRERPDQVLRHLRMELLLAAQETRPAHPPLLILDRMEALFDPQGADEASAVLGCLEALVRSQLLLVLAICRNDFYPELAQHPTLMRDKAQGAHMDLQPPDAQELAQIVRLPARAAGLLYGTDASGLHRLDDRLCADAARAQDALPLLQYTLHSLYLGRAPGNELSWEAYDALGGLEGAIGSRAEQILAALPAARQQALARVLPKLMSLSAEDALPVGRWLIAAELQDADERALVHALVEARLLVADRVGAVAGIRVAHEALLRRWPRVAAWVAQHRAHLAAREELAPWVQRWLEGAQAKSLLLSNGATLAQAGRSVAEAPQLFGEQERDYIARSKARLRRQVRGRWAAFAGTACLALLAGFMAVRNADLAEISAARELQSRRLAAFMLGDLADQLRPIGKLDLLGSIGEQGVKLLSAEGMPGESPADILQRAKSLVVIGEVNSSRGKGRTELALAALEEARRLLIPLEGAARLKPADYYPTLGASAFWIGQIAYDSGDLEAAARAMELYREASERWQRADAKDPGARAELGFALNSLGSIAMRRGAWSEAKRWLEESLALKLAALAARPGDVDTLDAVASSRTWLGQVAYVRGELREALAQLDAAELIRQHLLQRRSGEIVRQHDMGVLAVRRAEVLQGLGQRVEAVHSLETAIDVLGKASANDPSNLYWQAETRHAEAALLLARLDAGAAVEAQLQKIRTQMAAAPADGALAREHLWHAALTRVDAATAQLAARRTDWAGSLAADTEGRRRLSELRQARPRDWQLLELQARLDLLRMRRLEALGKAGEQQAACTQTRNELKPAVDAGQGGLVLEVWLLASACAGAVPADEGRLRQLTAGAYQAVVPAILPSTTPTFPSGRSIHE